MIKNKNYGDEIAKARDEIARLNDRLDALTKAIEAARPMIVHQKVIEVGAVSAADTAAEVARLMSLSGGAS